MKCPSCGFEFGSKTKKVPLSEARQGCILIAENIRCLTEGGLVLLLCGKGFRRIPHILGVLGMDEAGKVLKIIRKSVEAGGASPTTVLEIQNWYTHSAKGPVAGEMGIFAVEWLTGVLKSDPFMVKNGQLKDQEYLNRYRAHLKNLKDHFSEERNSIIYADYEDGEGAWSISGGPEFDLVLFDMILLNLFSKIVVNWFNGGKSFLELDESMRSIKDCTDLQEALVKLDNVAGTSFNQTLRDLKE